MEDFLLRKEKSILVVQKEREKKQIIQKERLNNDPIIKINREYEEKKKKSEQNRLERYKQRLTEDNLNKNSSPNLKRNREGKPQVDKTAEPSDIPTKSRIQSSRLKKLKTDDEDTSIDGKLDKNVEISKK
eukprot:CAMPEP_0116951772 /NCGR_PEP_ID=MMETSP0467-20121206/40328_1 /TAXON_ID=283647 /ORGANISM="Mesodinium pulex, Strain SPMC105" /LENGTH=129 /DNA_ID=CAMNT_0004636901 /DNA_START=260 /DNA_END=649 /DNA_ORIENTATION=+